MRPGSPQYLSHIGVELTAENRRICALPEMFAHGYQALTDKIRGSIIKVVEGFPGYERGLRYNDPFNIEYLPVSVISQRCRLGLGLNLFW